MAPPARPQAEDVVISHCSPAVFTLTIQSRTPQVRCHTFEEALQRASTFASNEHVRVWFTADDREFTPLADEDILRKLWTDYVEMPGLRLTREQAQRLWSVDERTCTQLLDNLVNAQLLVRGPDGRYARRTESASPPRAQTAKASIAPQSKAAFRQIG